MWRGEVFVRERSPPGPEKVDQSMGADSPRIIRQKGEKRAAKKKAEKIT